MSESILKKFHIQKTRFSTKEKDSNKTRNPKKNHSHVSNRQKNRIFFFLDCQVESGILVKLKEHKAGGGEGRQKCS